VAVGQRLIIRPGSGKRRKPEKVKFTQKPHDVCGFFGGIGTLLELLEAVFQGGARGFLWLLRSKSGAENSEKRNQNQEALAYGSHGLDS
jgi:hypothetical protein